MIQRREGAALVKEVAPRPVARLLHETAAHATNVVRGEVRLALAYARDEVTTGARRMVLLGVSALFGVLALVLTMAAAISLLSTQMPFWIAIAIVAGVNAVIALGLIWHTARRTPEAR